MTTIVTPERTVDDKGKIKVREEDNAMIIMEHEKGVLSHIECGFNYFDPYGHLGKGQEKATISLYGSHGNMHMVGYDWAPNGGTYRRWIIRYPSISFRTPMAMFGKKVLPISANTWH